MSMSMESMEWGRELGGGAVGVVVDVGVGAVRQWGTCLLRVNGV